MITKNAYNAIKRECTPPPDIYSATEVEHLSDWDLKFREMTLGEKYEHTSPEWMIAALKRAKDIRWATDFDPVTFARAPPITPVEDLVPVRIAPLRAYTALRYRPDDTVLREHIKKALRNRRLRCTWFIDPDVWEGLGEKKDGDWAIEEAVLRCPKHIRTLKDQLGILKQTVRWKCVAEKMAKVCVEP